MAHLTAPRCLQYGALRNAVRIGLRPGWCGVPSCDLCRKFHRVPIMHVLLPSVVVPVLSNCMWQVPADVDSWSFAGSDTEHCDVPLYVA
jgi:hypothetical protein